MRNETKYNEIIGILEDGSVYVLDDIFAYSDGLKGATHYTMEVLTKEQVEEYNSPDYVADTYADLWKDAVANGGEVRSLADFIGEIIEDTESNSDLLFPSDDPSFRYEMDKAIEKLSEENRRKIEALKDEHFVDWSVISCGRVGDDMDKLQFKEVFRPDLVEKIKEAEGE